MNNEKQMTSRDLQAIERRQQLLSAAKKLFAQNGYHNTPVRAITQSIGMADGLIYHYFPNGKMEMLHTLFEEGCEVLVKQVNKITDFIREEMTLSEVMLHFCNTLRNTFEVDNELIIIMFHEKDLIEEETNKLLSNAFVGMWTVINNFIKRRAQKGEIKQLDFGMATHQFMTTVASTVIMKQLAYNLTEKDTDAYIRNLVNFTIDSWKNQIN